MRVVLDLEANSLRNPTKIWLVVCKDTDTNQIYIFRNLTTDENNRRDFLDFAKGVERWIGHNLIDYDLAVLKRLIGFSYLVDNCTDTLILSRLVNYARPNGHSLEAYGEEFGLPKIKFNDWTKWSQEMEDYCVRDVEINHKVYLHYRSYTVDNSWHSAIKLEHSFQQIINDLQTNGFAFNKPKAEKLLGKVSKELEELDFRIQEAFPPRQIVAREFTPRATKHGTIAKNSVPRSLWDNIHKYEIDKTYPVYQQREFNPSSHKQLIEVLNEAGWRPEDRTTTHIDTDRKLSRLRSVRDARNNVDPLVIKALNTKLDEFKRTGWKVNELNLSTLPEEAPEGARILAKRILLEARRRSLVEWIKLVEEDGRIRGQFQGIGAWTQRMSHRRPNTANIPTPMKEDGTPKLLGKEMRELWTAPKDRLLVGVDAEGIQLRIFAHYIDDPEFTEALVKGSKHEKTDPHSLNQRILGSVCKSRQAAKRFVYALLLGGGIGKLSQILDTTKVKTTEALDHLLERYKGFAKMRTSVFPADAKRGYFIGLDGRLVPIPGETQRDREHLAMSGYLQNGEAIIIKRSAIQASRLIREDPTLSSWKFVDIIHDELQSECINKMSVALKIAEIKAQAIKEAGEYYKLRCPMQGSYYNEDRKDYTIGRTWYSTH